MSSSEDTLHKARLSYKLGANKEDISDYLGVSKDIISYYLEDLQGLSNEDVIDYNLESVLGSNHVKYTPEQLENKVSEIAIDLVEQIYDEWKSLEEASNNTGNISVSVYDSENIIKHNMGDVNQILGEEEHGKELDIDSNKIQENHTVGDEFDVTNKSYREDDRSLKTLLISQRYVEDPGPSEDWTEIEAIEWFIDERGGNASESEIKEFTKFFLNKELDFPERRIWDASQISDKISQRGIIKRGGKKSEDGDRLYKLEETPNVEKNLDKFLSDTMKTLQSELEEGDLKSQRIGNRRLLSRFDIDKLLDNEQ